MPKPKAKETISSILLGDNLAELVAQLGSEPDAKMIVIVVGKAGVKVAISPSMSKPESLGSLTLAADAIAYGGGFVWK